MPSDHKGLRNSQMGLQSFSFPFGTTSYTLNALKILLLRCQLQQLKEIKTFKFFDANASQTLFVCLHLFYSLNVFKGLSVRRGLNSNQVYHKIS